MSCPNKPLRVKMIMSVLTQVSRWTNTGSIKPSTVTIASVVAVHFQTWIFVDFTVSTCTHTHAYRIR